MRQRAKGCGDCRYQLRCQDGGRRGTVDDLKGTRGHHSGTVFRCGRIDPCGGWFVRRCWCFFDKAFGVFAERLVKSDLTGGVNRVDLTVMHLVRGHETNPGVVMLLVVPIEELAAEASGVLGLPTN
jgi:hypothetical protein